MCANDTTIRGPEDDLSIAPDFQATDQRRDRHLADDLTDNGSVAVDDVFIVPANALARDVAGVVQVSDQPLGRSLGDANRLGDLARGAGRITRDVEQYSRLIRQK